MLQYPENVQGTWNGFFENHNPLVLELACGKGEYTVGLAELYPNKNFIGVDKKGNRLWVGAKKAINHRLNNVAFLRIQIEQIEQYFSNEEVDEIWITFPDPRFHSRNSLRLQSIPVSSFSSCCKIASISFDGRCSGKEKQI